MWLSFFHQILMPHLLFLMNVRRKECTFMIRVYCLYRVSTIGQVEKNDIPDAAAGVPSICRRKGMADRGRIFWKRSFRLQAICEQREALQGDKTRCASKTVWCVACFYVWPTGPQGWWDTLRGGVVRQNGVKVWSVVEGEQRFDDHIDKLLNYIRFWQSSGESLKTSIRTKARMGSVIPRVRLCRRNCALWLPAMPNGPNQQTRSWALWPDNRPSGVTGSKKNIWPLLYSTGASVIIYMPPPSKQTTTT